jgi:hypothetical protein
LQAGKKFVETVLISECFVHHEALASLKAEHEQEYSGLLRQFSSIMGKRITIVKRRNDLIDALVWERNELLAKLREDNAGLGESKSSSCDQVIVDADEDLTILPTTVS